MKNSQNAVILHEIFEKYFPYFLRGWGANVPAPSPTLMLLLLLFLIFFISSSSSAS